MLFEIELGKGVFSDWNELDFEALCAMGVNALADLPECFKHFFFVVFSKIIPQNVSVLFIGCFLHSDVHLAADGI
jgi:hypothetical protein